MPTMAFESVYSRGWTRVVILSSGEGSSSVVLFRVGTAMPFASADLTILYASGVAMMVKPK